MIKIPFGKPIIDFKEKKIISSVLDSGTLVHGPKAKEFEQKFKKFTGAKDAITVSSCTAGMHLFYFTLNIGKGDEVIIPSQTHVATAHAVELSIHLFSWTVNSLLEISILTKSKKKLPRKQKQ